MRRKYWQMMAAILVLLVAADVIYWQIASVRLRNGLQAWIAALRSQGWDVSAGALSTSGWPQAATVIVPNLTLRHAGPDIPGTLSWASADVTVSLSLYHPTQLEIGLTGPQHIRIGDAPDVIVTGEQIGLTAGLLHQEDTLPLTLHAQNLRIEPAGGGWHLTAGLLNADAEVTPAAAQSEPAVTFAVSTEAIALPATMKWPLGSNISSLSVDGALNGPLPQVRNITGWAEAWRDAGGSLEISHFALGWGSLGLTSTATLALDDQLQPMGSGSSRLVGYAETLDKLGASGVLSRSAAIAAKAVLSLMAGTGMAGTADTEAPSAVDVPLTLQYRTLSMRQVPLVRLPELDWPDRQ
jgi:hypothetical protein